MYPFGLPIAGGPTRARVLAAMLAAASAAAGSPAEPAEGPRLGALIEPAQLVADGAGDSGAPTPLLLTLTARWDEIDREPGVWDWSQLAPEVERLHAAGHPLVLRLVPVHPRYLPEGGLPAPEVGDSLAAWLSFARSAVRTFAGRVTAFQIAGPPSQGELPAVETYAFLLKNSALAVRAEARKAAAPATVAQITVGADGLAWQRSLWAQDVAAYIDVIPFEVVARNGDDGAVPGLRELLDENLRHPPASRIWAFARPVADDAVPAALARAIRALAEGADAALADLRAVEAPAALRCIGAAQALLAGGQAPAPQGDVRLVDASGAELPGAGVVGRFFSDRDFSTVIFYLAPGGGDLPPGDRLILDDPTARNARWIDLATGDEQAVAVVAAGELRAIRVGRGPWPFAVRYARGAGGTGFELPPESIETTRTRELTAEEIIARYQAVQRVQDDRLERVISRGRVDFHFRMVQGGSTIDVGIESNYFWERGGRLEWEQTDYYINGNRTRWKSFPRLPLIQPEKVITLPLDLTLDRTYTYRLIGRDRVDEREAYELEFQPADPDAPASLYRGRVWIDVESFQRVKLSLVQTGLDVPVLSNEEIDRFRPVTGADGVEYRLLTRVDGQQTWNTGGRTFVVQREMTFRDFEINPDAADFEARRSAAYASRNTMLADTDEGFRYLDRQDDGTRAVKQRVATSQLFVVAGALEDGSTDGVTPLAGVNYFNYDLFGKNVQVNALFAGVLGLFTVSKPDLVGRRGDLTADAFMTAIKFTDRIYAQGEELEHETIRDRPQQLNLRLGLPVGQFWKVNLLGSVRQNRYFHEGDADDAIREFNAASAERELEFVLPADNTEIEGGAELEFNRRGYSLALRGTTSQRSDWEPWGLVDVSSGEYGSVDPRSGEFVAHAPEPLYERSRQWRATLFKEWFLPHFQKTRFEVNYLDGRDLDRFSRYGFSQFGATRLNGFSGSGVRFDRGFVGRAGYAFNVAKILQLNAVVETARVERRDDPEGRQSFTGLGLNGNFPAPWKTVVSVSYGYGLASDVPDLEGESEFLLLVFKLF